jgi:hypothetical protein
MNPSDMQILTSSKTIASTLRWLPSRQERERGDPCSPILYPNVVSFARIVRCLGAGAGESNPSGP